MNRISMVAVCSVNNTQCFVRTAVIVVFGFLAASVLADVSALPDPLFQGNQTLDMTITGPLSSLVRERPTDKYSADVLEYTETDGTPVKFDLEIRTRGNSRHKNCEYPPVSLNLRKSQTRGTLYRGRCVNNEYVAKSLQKFGDSRESIYALINDQEGLQSGVRGRLIAYTDDFYDLINDPKKVEQRIMKKCI